MKVFEYELLYPDGQRNSGKVLAENNRTALDKLRINDCKILKLEEVKERVNKGSGSFSAINKVLFVANLNLRLAGQLRAGIALRRALDNIKSAADEKRKLGLQEVIEALDAGQTFAGALSTRRDLYPDFMRNMVSVGENTGALAEILQDVSDYYFDLYEMQTHLKQISLYPLFLCTLILALLLAFVEFVVPSFASLYTMLNIELHGVLRGLLLIRENLLVILFSVLLVLALVLKYLQYKYQQDGNYVVDIALRIPVLGKFCRNIQEVRFCRVLSMQLRSGVDLLSALQMSKNCVTGTSIQNMLEQVILDLTRGIGLYEAAKMHNSFLAEDTLEFLAVGEGGNGYAEMLTLAHTQARMNLKNMTASMKVYAQPVIFLITAITLGAVIIVLLQPMLGVLENVGSNW